MMQLVLLVEQLAALVKVVKLVPQVALVRVRLVLLLAELVRLASLVPQLRR